VEVQAVGSSFDGLSIQQPLSLDRSLGNGELTGNTRPSCEKRSLESTVDSSLNLLTVKVWL